VTGNVKQNYSSKPTSIVKQREYKKKKKQLFKYVYKYTLVENCETFNTSVKIEKVKYSMRGRKYFKQ